MLQSLVILLARSNIWSILRGQKRRGKIALNRLQQLELPKAWL